MLLAYAKEIEGIIKDIKYHLEKCKARLGVQYALYCKVVKISYILFSITEVDILE